MTCAVTNRAYLLESMTRSVTSRDAHVALTGKERALHPRRSRWSRGRDCGVGRYSSAAPMAQKLRWHGLAAVMRASRGRPLDGLFNGRENHQAVAQEDTMSAKTFEDLFLDELKDVYDAEKRLVKA